MPTMKRIKNGRNAHFFGRQYGNIVFVDGPRLFLDQLRIGLAFELLARQPEQDVLLAEFRAQEVAEILATFCNVHTQTNR